MIEHQTPTAASDDTRSDRQSGGLSTTVVGTPEATTLARVRALGVVPVVELTLAEDGAPLVEALNAAGLPVAEITLRTSAALEALATLRSSYPDTLIGGGTVRTLEDARQVVDVGAQFVVSPSTNPEVIEFCRAQHVLVIPGVCTPTEIDLAVRAGARVVKFFPSEALGGVSFLRALSGPFQNMSFVPTGGINASNLAEYLRLGQVVACGGSWMVAPPLLRERRFAEIEMLARQAVEIVTAARGGTT